MRVRNVVNGRQVTIRINDRGPYVKGRILDLSYKAAQELNMVRDGVSAVYLEVISHQGLESLASDHHVLKTREYATAGPSPVGNRSKPRQDREPADSGDLTRRPSHASESRRCAS